MGRSVLGSERTTAVHFTDSVCGNSDPVGRRKGMSNAGKVNTEFWANHYGWNASPDQLCAVLRQARHTMRLASHLGSLVRQLRRSTVCGMAELIDDIEHVAGRAHTAAIRVDDMDKEMGLLLVPKPVEAQERGEG